MSRFGEGGQEAVTARTAQQQNDAVDGATDGLDAGWGTGELPTVAAVGGADAGWEPGEQLPDDEFGEGENLAYQDTDGDGYPDVPDLAEAGV